jgi:hypothetical protein
MAELSTWMADHEESFASDSDRRFMGFVAELDELGTLVGQHVPDLIDYVPLRPDPSGNGPTIADRTKGMEVLYRKLQKLSTEKAQPEPQAPKKFAEAIQIKKARASKTSKPKDDIVRIINEKFPRDRGRRDWPTITKYMRENHRDLLIEAGINLEKKTAERLERLCRNRPKV